MELAGVNGSAYSDWCTPMLLTPQNVELFFRLHRTLMFFVNQRLKVLPDDVASPDAFSSLSPAVRLKVRDAFLSHTDLIQQFVDENPSNLTTDELDIVRSWRHLVHGKFYIFRELKGGQLSVRLCQRRYRLSGRHDGGEPERRMVLGR